MLYWKWRWHWVLCCQHWVLAWYCSQVQGFTCFHWSNNSVTPKKIFFGSSVWLWGIRICWGIVVYIWFFSIDPMGNQCHLGRLIQVSRDVGVLEFTTSFGWWCSFDKEFEAESFLWLFSICGLWWILWRK